MAKAAKEEVTGIDVTTIQLTVRKAIERALSAQAQIGSVKLSSKDNSLKLTLELTVKDVRLQLLPLEVKQQPQDDLSLADA